MLVTDAGEAGDEGGEHGGCHGRSSSQAEETAGPVNTKRPAADEQPGGQREGASDADRPGEERSEHRSEALVVEVLRRAEIEKREP